MKISTRRCLVFGWGNSLFLPCKCTIPLASRTHSALLTNIGSRCTLVSILWWYHGVIRIYYGSTLALRRTQAGKSACITVILLPSTDTLGLRHLWVMLVQHEASSFHLQSWTSFHGIGLDECTGYSFKIFLIPSSLRTRCGIFNGAILEIYCCAPVMARNQVTCRYVLVRQEVMPLIHNFNILLSFVLFIVHESIAIGKY